MALGHHTCVGCKKKSPETELNYSLLGLAGWREQRKKDLATGEIKSEWRCPECWASHKKATRAQTQFNLPSINSTTRRKDG